MTRDKAIIDPPCSAAHRIGLWYRKIGVLNGLTSNRKPIGWSRARFLEMCRKLNITPTEAAAICAAQENDFNRWLKSGTFPPYISLHFALLEAAWLYAKTGAFPSVIPFHEILR